MVAVGVKTVITKRLVFAALITVSALTLYDWGRFAINDFSILSITLVVLGGNLVNL
jgi:hypothetical protein